MKHSPTQHIIILPLLLLCTPVQSIKIDRVILATDAHPDYIPLWPFAALFWKEVVGVKHVTLALVADENVTVDERVGDVIRFKPIPGIKTSLQAQTIRLLLPAYYPDEVCMPSDIDMMPVNKDYFTKKIQHIPRDHFVVYHDKAYGPNQYQFCYNVALGNVFAEIFNTHNPDVDIPNRIREWHNLNLGWTTDQQVLARCVKQWEHFKDRCTLLGGRDIGKTDKRISRRHKFNYDKKRLRDGYYIDMHVPRPVNEACYKKVLGLMRDLGLENKIKQYGLDQFPSHYSRQSSTKHTSD